MTGPLTADERLEITRFAAGFYEAQPDLLRALLRTVLAEVARLDAQLGRTENLLAEYMDALHPNSTEPPDLSTGET